MVRPRPNEKQLRKGPRKNKRAEECNGIIVRDRQGSLARWHIGRKRQCREQTSHEGSSGRVQKESEIDVIKKSPLCVLIVEAGRDNPSSFARTYRPPSCIRISNNIAIAERHRQRHPTRRRRRRHRRIRTAHSRTQLPSRPKIGRTEEGRVGSDSVPSPRVHPRMS